MVELRSLQGLSKALVLRGSRNMPWCYRHSKTTPAVCSQLERRLHRHDNLMDDNTQRVPTRKLSTSRAAVNH
ncbi:unnamed protein product [Urochloa humidicola]